MSANVRRSGRVGRRRPDVARSAWGPRSPSPQWLEKFTTTVATLGESSMTSDAAALPDVSTMVGLSRMRAAAHPEKLLYRYLIRRYRRPGRGNDVFRPRPTRAI